MSKKLENPLSNSKIIFIENPFIIYKKSIFYITWLNNVCTHNPDFKQNHFHYIWNGSLYHCIDYQLRYKNIAT